ncbi:hypothetical protein Moror_14857 [Moniliophthora roreri MCA 2997]|uniref:F-box domain-containing protein n=2 Tax=Moniliophthora roreri TaxID=221103 RepID=V2Y9F0_MONRO|nr:hypothetical protein Moror_14857 [Moniliophthora roreri MCA 2997]KAI3607830.1 hypothetical protein WG66_004591 [Moniliophthora roreri]
MNFGLPNELLAYIFTLCTKYEGALYLPSTSDTLYESQALTLAAVCTYWRALALDTPRMWSCIVISPSRSRDKVSASGSRDKHLFRLHLERSRDAPISLSLPDPDSTNNEGTQWIWDTLTKYTRRIKHLTFSLGPREWMFGDILQTLSSSHPEFTSLESTITRHCPGQPQTLVLDCSLPRLHTLSVYNEPPSHPEKQIETDFTKILAFPWTQITTLSFNLFPSTDVDGIISFCPELHALYICVSGDGSNGRALGNGPIMAPKLQKLTIYLQTTGTTIATYHLATNLLDRFICPKLEELSLKTMDLVRWRLPSDDISATNPLEDFIYRSGCTLRQLTLDNVPIPLDTLPWSLFKCLRSLVVGECMFFLSEVPSTLCVKDLLHGLVLPANRIPAGLGLDRVHGGTVFRPQHFARSILPDLKELKVVAGGEAVESLQKVVASRSRIPGRNLESVCLILSRLKERGKYMEVERLQQAAPTRLTVRVGTSNMGGKSVDIARSMYTTRFRTGSDVWDEWE